MLCLIIHPNVAVMCDVEYVRCGVMLNVVSCNVRRGVQCGDAMWNAGVVHGEYGGVL